MSDAATPIALDYYNRRVSVPIGRKLPENIDLNEEVEIIIKGKVKRLEAAEPKGAHYKNDPGRPAEISIELTSVTIEGTTNTFTRLSKTMEVSDD